MVLFALTIFAGAFLLFQIQPMIARAILPWFGGTAAVWGACLLFFQAALLVGYLYAHALVRWLGPRGQAAVHAALLLGSAFFLPAVPAAAWKPAGGEDPAGKILWLLAVTIGLPYVLLSGTGPLLQAWYARRYPWNSPYRLYALSNAGSLLALLSYPVLVEPWLTTRQQALSWSGLYGIFILLCGVAAMRSALTPVTVSKEDADGARPTRATRVRWVTLPACACLLLMAVTNHTTENIAAVPLLWVIPLSLYLLSLVLCFDGRGWYRRGVFLPLAAVALPAMLWGIEGQDGHESLAVQLPLYWGGLFVCAMVCHGETARLKPHPRYLTAFYLSMAAGGVLGGAFVALVAPLVFRGPWELPVGLVVFALLVRRALVGDRRFRPFRPWTAGWSAGLTFTLALGAFAWYQSRGVWSSVRRMERNFYGVLRVRDEGPAGKLDSVRNLLHGSMTHGTEFLHPLRRLRPTSYYSWQSGLGVLMERLQREQPAMRVGVVGLGAGTTAAYGRAGDYYRFYEINPLVVDLARSEFYFLSGTPARLDVVAGDGRLSLEREAPQNFDLLIVDAFSGDSIPVHLLTREAFELYSRHLSPRGVLAMHVSHRYLPLFQVVREQAEAMRVPYRLLVNRDNAAAETWGAFWMVLTRRPGFFDAPEFASQIVPPRRPRARWSDDCTNLFGLLY